MITQSKAGSEEETVFHLLRRFDSTTLSCSSARRRNSFRLLLRMNGTANIAVASPRLDASDQQVWCPSLHANRR